MKKALTIAIAAGLLASGTAAQAETFTVNIQFEAPTFYGGMGETGRDGRSGIMNGTYTVASSTGAAAGGSITCIGMDQPDNGLFDFHLSCTATRDEGGGTSSLIMGCNDIPEQRGAACVGGLEGRTGTLAGRNGMITMHLGNEGATVGTGQWVN